MFSVLFSLVIAIGAYAADSAPDISGSVAVSKDFKLSPTGVLFIIARPAGAATPGTPPVAVVRMPQPVFPQKFTIGSANSMMGGKFGGTMSITARYAATGDALDKTGPQGVVLKAKPGQSGIKIELK